MSIIPLSRNQRSFEFWWQWLIFHLKIVLPFGLKKFSNNCFKIFIYKYLFSQLDITDIFSAQADLSGITSTQPPLAVSDIIQQVNIDVDETGSTAAAATGAVVFPLSFEVNPEQPKEFTVDEPFLFIISQKNEIPLFVGKVVKPKE